MRNDWPTPAEAIARYRAAPPGKSPRSWLSRGSPGSELLATRDAEAYAEWLCRTPSDPPVLGSSKRQEGGGELRGLVLRGGQGSTGLPADNPWGLPAVTDLEQVVRTLWAPAADCTPAFIDRLVESVFAVAMVRRGNRDYLAYLTAAWVSRDVRDIATASIEELMDARELTVGKLLGSAPFPDSGETVPVLGAAMPAPLRAVAAVHRSLTILDDNTYIDLEKLQAYHDFVSVDEPDPDEPEDDLPEGEYVVFAQHQETWYVLDLDVRDESGAPTVVEHDPNDWLILTTRKSLGRFLAENLPRMLDIGLI